MANTTGLSNKITQTPWTTDVRLELGAATVAATTFFYDGQAVGRDSGGNMVQMDDTAKAEFLGILKSVVDKQQVNSTDSVGQTIFFVDRPQMFTANISGAVAGDEGRRVYWQFNETLAYTGLTNWNYAGTVFEVLQPTGQSTVTQVTVIPPWMAREMGDGAAQSLQAGPNSGTTTFTKYNVNNDYTISDTASLVINLPVSTTVSSGDAMTFIKIGSGANTISLKPQGSDSVNSSTAQFNSTTVQFTRIVAETDGSGNWYVRQY